MRGWRSTAALAVIFVGLMAYIYFVESKRTPSSEAAEKKQKVFSIEQDKISDLVVKSASGDRTSLKKVGGRWQIDQPLGLKPDDSEVSGITSNISTVEIQRVVDENPPDLKEYGLAPPRVDVGFKTSGDKDFKHLLIGEKTATGGDLYAKLPNEKRVFLISGFLDSSFNRSTFDLRDKAILKFDREKVESLDLSTPTGVVALAKSGPDWKLVKPVQGRADYSTVEGVIGRLQTAQMKSVVSAEGGDLKQYGLDHPEVSATVAAGSARATLALGNKTSDGNVYARDLSRPAVFTVESSLADELKKPASEYRRKDVFEFRAFNANRIEIARGGQIIVFEKVKGQGKDAQDKWRRVPAGGGAPTDISLTAMEGALTKLANLRAQSFADAKTNTGLNTPVATISVTFDDAKKQEKVTVGKSGEDTYVARPDEPGAAKIDTKEFDEAIKALDEVK
jgi:hypothetical protein